MPRFLVQRVQEVVVEAESYPGAVAAMKELNLSLFWQERKAATFVLPGQLAAREPEFRRSHSGLERVKGESSPCHRKPETTQSA